MRNMPNDKCSERGCHATPCYQVKRAKYPVQRVCGNHLTLSIPMNGDTMAVTRIWWESS